MDFADEISQQIKSNDMHSINQLILKSHVIMKWKTNKIIKFHIPYTPTFLEYFVPFKDMC